LEKLIKKFKTEDNVEFTVSEQEGNFHVLAKFPFLTGNVKYKNNFIHYVATDLSDKETAIGIASFAFNCYQRGMKNQTTV
jgi:hypothetical protein